MLGRVSPCWEAVEPPPTSLLSSFSPSASRPTGSILTACSRSLASWSWCWPVLHGALSSLTSTLDCSPPWLLGSVGLDWAIFPDLFLAGASTMTVGERHPPLRPRGFPEAGPSPSLPEASLGGQQACFPTSWASRLGEGSWCREPEWRGSREEAH